jgi:nucleoside-diphosphate-sugar epimerase
MKVLVAGGEGYLGSVICNKLAERGHDVTSYDLGWFPTKLDSKIKINRGNCFKISNLKGYDSVIFVAGLSNDPMADRTPKESFAYNAGLPFYLAKLAKAHGVPRFIYASSCSVYGWNNKVVSETDTPLTDTYYGMSKLQGENSVLSLGDNNFHVCAFRMGTLSGPSPRMRFDLLVNTMFKSALTTGTITVNDSEIWRPICHVADAARLYVQAVEEAPMTGIYNVACHNYQIIDVANYVRTCLADRLAINIVELGQKDIRNYQVSCLKLALTKFSFEYNIKYIIQHLMGQNYSDFDSDVFYNIKVYEAMI